MTYEEFKRQVGKAGLDVKEFAELLKLNPNTITNNAKDGVVPNHYAVIATLMGEMRERQIDFKTILSQIDFVPKESKSGGRAKFGGDKQETLF